MSPDNKLKCAFCGKAQDKVKKLIAGPGVQICNECVMLCLEILAEEGFAHEIAQNFNSWPGEITFKPTSSRPHPLEQFPLESIDSTIGNMASFIDAFEKAGAELSHNRELFSRCLLVLQERKFGATAPELSPSLNKLLDLYESKKDYNSCIEVLKWISLIEETNGSKRADSYLLRMLRMCIRQNKQNQAEEILNQLAARLCPATEEK